jgi:diketogulonate reductase-like aldo/keto reductase
MKGERMGTDELDELGPIDLVLIEWPGAQPTGEALPHLVDLVDRGIIRILDLAFITKSLHHQE